MFKGGPKHTTSTEIRKDTQTHVSQEEEGLKDKWDQIRPRPTMLTEQDERALLWGDISHLYNKCGGGSDGDWNNENMNADPAWNELNRLLNIAASCKWTKPVVWAELMQKCEKNKVLFIIFSCPPRQMSSYLQMSNMLQMIQDGLVHIHNLRLDPHTKPEDILGDMEQRFIKLMSRIVTTPNVDNFLLPIHSFDQNDVFLNKDSIVENKSWVLCEI